MASGYRTELWTTARIAELISRNFGVTYHRDHVGRLLAALGFSYQKPEGRALERDDEAIVSTPVAKITHVTVKKLHFRRS